MWFWKIPLVESTNAMAREKHFQEWSAELQIPPLRFAPVGMTKGRVALPFRFDSADDEQQVPIRLRSGQALHFATPDTLRSG
jgi:hypothetical protein